MQADSVAAVVQAGGAKAASGGASAVRVLFGGSPLDGQPDQSLLAYQYLQMLPKIAEGDAGVIRSNPRVIEAYLGKGAAGAAGAAKPA